MKVNGIAIGATLERRILGDSLALFNEFIELKTGAKEKLEKQVSFTKRKVKKS